MSRHFIYQSNKSTLSFPDYRLDPAWKFFAVAQSLLFAIAFIDPSAGEIAAKVLVGICFISGIFLPFKFSLLSLSGLIMGGSSLTLVSYGATFYVDREIVLSYIFLPIESLAAIVLFLRLWLENMKYRKSRVPLIKDKDVSKLFLWIFVFIIIDSITRLEPTISVKTMLGVYLRFLCLIAGMYYIGTRLSQSNLFLYLVAISIPTYFIGVSVGINTFLQNPYTLDALSQARSSGLSDPNAAAISMLVCVFGAIVTVFESKKRFVKVLMFVLATLGLLTLFWGSSRNGVITALLVLIISFYFMKKNRIKYMLMGCMLLPIIWHTLPDINKSRILSSRDRSVIEERMELGESALNMFLENPIIGSGIAYYHSPAARIKLGAHNTYLNMLAQGGLLYITAWLMVIYIMVRHIRNKYNCVDNKPKIVFYSMLYTYLIGSFGLSIEILDPMGSIFMAGMLLIIGHNGRFAKKRVSSIDARI